MDWLANLQYPHLQFSDPQLWASLLTLTVMEIVLGIDNLIFIAILAARLPHHLQGRARRIGLLLALGLRLGLLASIVWIMRLTEPVLEVLGHAFSWRDLILIGGGVFLVYKGTTEIHERIEGESPHAASAAAASFFGTIAQIVVIDVVFSLDSVITAVGMANELAIMMAAVAISVGVMMVASGPVAAFVNRHPTVKMLALSFLLLIGTMLVADGFGMHVSKGYIYAAIGFSALVESLNQLAARRRASPAKLASRPPA
jgi:predicted tellurium resistance membrane protein TerC